MVSDLSTGGRDDDRIARQKQQMKRLNTKTAVKKAIPWISKSKSILSKDVENSRPRVKRKLMREKIPLRLLIATENLSKN